MGRALTQRKRENIVSRMSTDGGKTWPASYLVEPGPAGYSDLVQIDGKRIGILYERGTNESSRPRISFRTWSLEDYHS